MTPLGAMMMAFISCLRGSGYRNNTAGSSEKNVPRGTNVMSRLTWGPFRGPTEEDKPAL
jgi:hypothetical protein